ncbi:MAG: HEAT repeat domain-containing protein [Chloroflexota bacterium]
MLNYKVLLEGLNSDDPAAQIAAKEKFLEHPRMALPVLVELMLTQPGRQGWRAALLVAAMKDASTIPSFVLALKSPNALIRQTAAQMLGELGDESIVPHLLASLSDDSLGVQMWTIEALGNLHTQQAIQPLCRLITQTDVPEIQHTIIRAFGRIGDPTVTVYLVPFLNSANHHVRSRAQDVYRQLSNAPTGN